MRRNKHERKKREMRSTRGKSGWIWRSGAGPINAGSTAGDPRTSCGSVVSSIEIQARDGQKRRRWVEMVQNGPGDRVRG